MGGTNKIEFTDANHYINNSGSQLDIAALTNGTVKIGKYTDGDGANTTATVKLEGTTVNPNTNQFTFTAPNETPVVTLDSHNDAPGTTTTMIQKKIIATGGVAYAKIRIIDAKGENFEQHICIRALKAGNSICEIEGDEPKRIGGERKMKPFATGIELSKQIIQEFIFWKF